MFSIVAGDFLIWKTRTVQLTPATPAFHLLVSLLQINRRAAHELEAIPTKLTLTVVSQNCESRNTEIPTNSKIPNVTIIIFYDAIT